MTKKATIPTNLPADAAGFFAPHLRHPERLALYRADGSPSNTYSAGDTVADIAAKHDFGMYTVTTEGFLVAR